MRSAWLCGRIIDGAPLFSRSLAQAAWLLPYVATRLAVTLLFPAERATSGAFVSSHLVGQVELLPLLPLAWWMGLRAAITSLLAGWGVDSFEVAWRVKLFQLLTRINRHVELAPRLADRRAAHVAAP